MKELRSNIAQLEEINSRLIKVKVIFILPKYCGMLWTLLRGYAEISTGNILTTFHNKLKFNFNSNAAAFLEGSHIYWKTRKNIVHLENLKKTWNFAKNNKNHANIMENVGTLGYCGNDIFLNR